MYDGLEERAGYEPGFLQLPDGGEIPLPVITPAGKAALALQANGEAELKYHHFSVFMHAQRRLALFTAANVDWRMEKRLVNGEKPSREDLTGIPKNQNIMEQWVTDDRLPAEAQLPDSFFTNDRGAFDKGHLVRREDAAWGESFEDMQMANGDTYYTTNCSPQVRGYNQASLGDLNWGDLENLVQKQAAGEKVMVFSGPVFGTQDRIFFGKDDSGPVKVKIPREFWKIIVARTADGVKAYGFLLKQDLSGVRFREEEFVVPEEWQPQHKPIAAIEAKLSGLLDLSWFKQRDAHDGNG
jgi:endonuclease G